MKHEQQSLTTSVSIYNHHQSKLCGELSHTTIARFLSFILQSSSFLLMDAPAIAQVTSELELAQLPTIPIISDPSTPDVVLPEPEPQPTVEPLPSLEELLPQLEIPPNSPQAILEENPGDIIIEQFKVVGSTVFSAEELAAVLEPFTKQAISFTELLQAQEAITELYRDQGYVTSGAFIPPQSLQGGTVTIQVVEGEVEAITIKNTRRLNPSYIRSRVELGTTTPLNQEQLLEKLQLLQLNPLIENLQVELAAGSSPGKSTLEVTIEEASAFATELSLDNQRSPSVGSLRRRLQVYHSNLWGFGDRFDFSFFNTEGSNSLENISYSFPINPRNGTIALSHSRGISNVIEEPFNILDIESKSRTYELTYRQPLSQTPTEELVLGLTASRQEVQTLLGIDDIGPFPLSDGADDNGAIKISAVRFFQEYSKRNSQEIFAARSQFSFGLGVFDATINESEPDSEFFSWRTQAQYLRLLTSDITLLLRSDLQWSNEPLVALEQFSLGGHFNVRGYRQSLLLADKGLFTSAEVRATVLRIPEWNISLQLAPFFDFGTVSNNSNNGLELSNLYSLGLGLRFSLGNSFLATLDWGIPLVEVDNTGNSLQEHGLYFTMKYTLF
ncbi:MAG: ShlB/FhaC/HecB family hemolysin secretion/activation protein [Symploca sp. SIO2D2]|nr:ShlB/FhaC/HecB family hemolysin secretion/activation protein [Symploca sp. SIO2D2]